MYCSLSNEQQITSAASKHGASSGAREILRAESEAALQSISSGIYVTWQPSPTARIGASAAEGVRDGTSQCCRIGSNSVCVCGHALKDHAAPLNSAATGHSKKSHGFIRPPRCFQCRRCPGYSYIPFRPEECGQWWLPRRRDFDLKAWQQVLHALHLQSIRL